MKIFFTFFLMLISAAVFSQSGGVSINANGGSPDPSAALDINFNNKGLLMPRLTTAQMSSIHSIATGLVVFNTDSSTYYYYNGSIWTNLSSPGNNPGDMLYWTGSNWVVLPVGTNGQTLTLSGGIPAWTAPVVFLPTVISTTAATSITVSTATSGGVVSSNGGAAVTAYGVCWGVSPNPVLSGGNFTTDGTGTGAFTSSITGLSEGTIYYVCAYATNSAGTAYGPQITFTTPGPPTVISTTAASSITFSGASSGGDVTSSGGEPVTAYGVCWSTSPNPVLGAGNFTTDGAGTGTFASNITGLAQLTTYYVRAYATNSIGTAYGPQISFTTTSLAIGDSYGGGIVAYILQPGDAGYDANVVHGLIAATSDANSGAQTQWYNGSNIATGATGSAIGAGASNTATIISQQGPGTYAASVCKAYAGGGYTDWYLPSLDELNELYINEAAIGNMAGYYYWSSTEISSNFAWQILFPQGSQSNNFKSGLDYVRAVRSF